MADPVVGLLILVLSGVAGLITYWLDHLIDPVDQDATQRSELDSLELRVIRWFLVPLAKQISTSDTLLSAEDIEEVRLAYNNNVASLEKAKMLCAEFDRGRRNLFRSLLGGSVALIPAALIVASTPVQDWVAYSVWGLLALFVGFMFCAFYAVMQMRRIRKQYASITNALNERIGSQSLISLRSDREGGHGSA